ncbi:NAD(P)-binding Rossmann-fold containing protein [Venustampulla echinocandica]|uniref:NAD(P)-binding Rossmann-fold containing protein n=1 Tax=Venustampulla echinocandica TaxID=2656787 RepID=A0A370TQ23_9HELO|nr:NAD(P)-binding Rossmann-fold containing protein [Venustampulla echinocandica]RDL37619.1 NAD(P)-binding Rossmann-fold containing protein [Venustampulla echinocandica]
MTNVQAPPISRKMHDLTNQVVLITGIGSVGAGWGNGAAIAALFARQGAILFGCDLSLEAAETSKSKILSESPDTDIAVMRADATSSSSIKEFVDSCVAKHGRIDILINNVGRSEPGDPASLNEEVWDEQMNVNLKSVYLTSHLVLPLMAAQASGGNIVNISSVSGLRYIGKPQVAYSATKAAILSFTRTTAVIYAGKGVRLNTVVPGLINTPLVKVLADKYSGGDYEGYCKVRDQQVPMGRMGTAWDVANAVLFLASKEASYITGTEIVVDGGLTQSTGRV